MRRPDPSVDDSLNRYVLDHYRHLMSEEEREIVTALNFKLKALNSGDPVKSRKLSSARGLVAKPHVKAALEAGYHEARTQIRNRLLADNPDTIALNRCPTCGALCRTPAAKMCVSCGHSWHHQDDV